MHAGAFTRLFRFIVELYIYILYIVYTRVCDRKFSPNSRSNIAAHRRLCLRGVMRYWPLKINIRASNDMLGELKSTDDGLFAGGWDFGLSL